MSALSTTRVTAPPVWPSKMILPPTLARDVRPVIWGLGEPSGYPFVDDGVVGTTSNLLAVVVFVVKSSMLAVVMATFANGEMDPTAEPKPKPAAPDMTMP